MKIPKIVYTTIPYNKAIAIQNNGSNSSSSSTIAATIINVLNDFLCFSCCQSAKIVRDTHTASAFIV